MATPFPRNKILPARGLYADLSASLADILEGEICYALDEDQYYQKEGGVLVAVGATKTQGALADSATQPGDNISTLTNDAAYVDAAGASAAAPVQSVAGKTGAVSLMKGDVGLGNVDNTSDANKPVSTAQQAALDAKADLVGGVIPNSQLPSLAISEYLGTAADQTAMLTLTGQRGDWVIRTDTSTTWVITTDGGSLLSDWTELATPADAVSSVNGYQGTVVLSAADVGAATTAQGATADTAVQPGDTIEFAPATAAAPGLFPTGDPDTGIYSPGADQVAVSTGGTQRLQINASGNVGVGTTSPQSALSFASGSHIGVATTDAADNGVLTIGGAGAASNTRGSYIEFYGNENASQGNVEIAAGKGGASAATAGSIILKTGPGTADERVRIDSSGNVLVGTTDGNFASGKGLKIADATAARIKLCDTDTGVGATDGMDISLSGVDGYIENRENGALIVATNNTERLRIDSSGNIGVGTTGDPGGYGAKLAVEHTSDCTLTVNTSGATNLSRIVLRNSNFNGEAQIINATGGALAFFDGPTNERARIDDSGRLLVGTSTNTANVELNENIVSVIKGNQAVWNASLVGYSGSTSSTTRGPGLVFKRSRGTTDGDFTSVASGDLLARLDFYGADGTSFVSSAQIAAQVDGTPGANDMPGRLVFSTTADGASSPTERMRIDSEGNIKFGNIGYFREVTGSPYFIEFGSFPGTTYAVERQIKFYANVSGGDSAERMRISGAGSIFFPGVGTTASAANAFLNSGSSPANQLLRSTSSLRYKTSIEDLEEERSNSILNFRPVWYRSTADADRKDWSWYGLIAEEVAEIEPRLVHWTYLDDAYEEVDGEKQLKPDAEMVPDGVQYDRLTVLLLDVVKRQQQSIETLEASNADLLARISALEAN